jgi:DNA-binding beta-propeller fold protein YncE
MNLINKRATLIAIVVVASGGITGCPSPTYSISGTVSGDVREGVTVALSGAARLSTTTDATGSYSFADLRNGAYVVTPSLAGYAFSPSNIAVTVNGADVGGQNFTAKTVPATYAISGTVSGATASGVTITLAGAVSETTQTDASGSYGFSAIINGSYTLTPAKGGFVFSPVNRSVVVNGADVSGQNFTATTVSNAAITAFSFARPPANAVIDEAARTIAVIVPFGTSLTALVATFTTTGVSVRVGSTTQVSGVTANDFTNPVVYTVIDSHGSTSSYTATVTVKVREIYVANVIDDVVSTFGATATGNVGPTRQLGSLTGFAGPYGIALDSATNEIFVVNIAGNSIDAFARTANGNIAPLRTVAGANTGLISPRGIAVDVVNDQLFVTNHNGIVVFGRTDSGDVAPLRTISGADTGLLGPQGIALDLTRNEVFVVDYLNRSISVFHRTDTGNVAPARTIAGASTGLSWPTAIAVDTVNDQILVVNTDLATGQGSILVYGVADSGDVPPQRTISGTNTGLIEPSAVAVDTVNNEILVANNGEALNVYPRTASGNVAPERTISGTNTELGGSSGIAVDVVNNQIFVSNGSNSVTVYGRLDSGNIAPTRMISDADTGVRGPEGVGVDPLADQIWVANTKGNSLTVYDRSVSGDAVPARTIAGSNTGLNGPIDVAIDLASAKLVVANAGPGSYNSITVYGLSSSGNTTPLGMITGPDTGLDLIQAIAVDGVHGEIFAANWNGAITAFRETDTGDVAPLRTLLGTNTGLTEPDGIAVDAANNQLFVASSSTNAIMVFSREGNGNVSPIRTLSGAATGLSSPSRLVLDTVDNKLFVVNGDSILAFSATASGNVAPMQVISGASTVLAKPMGIALW